MKKEIAEFIGLSGQGTIQVIFRSSLLRFKHNPSFQANTAYLQQNGSDVFKLRCCQICATVMQRRDVPKVTMMILFSDISFSYMFTPFPIIHHTFIQNLNAYITNLLWHSMAALQC